ncbi:MAG: endonuclease [Prevotella sp.]|nr:endonuclease [Prevotella sp.]
MKNFVTSAILMLVCTTSFAQGPNDSGTYYQAADGKKGAELKTALCGIIYNRTEGGSLKTAYDALWTHFQTTDKKENGKVWDMYSNKREFTFVTDQAGNYKQEGDVYNREHSFPNSWFGGKVMPMYTDLHHLYPTDGYVNGRRSNYPFGETNGGTYKSANNFSKLGACTYSGYTGTVFEPNDEYKGDFARTYFYMVTCYEEKIPDWYTNYGVNNSTDQNTKNAVMATLDGSKYPGFTSWQLEMLLKWAKNDPVSEKETNRNKAVYGIQANRNPFIDYPGLEQYVWGDLKEQAFSYNNYVQPAGIGIVDVDADTTPAAIYTIDGRRLNEPQKGVNIMKMKSGKAKKIIKK